jgi:hypothetical protein
MGMRFEWVFLLRRRVIEEDDGDVEGRRR